MDQGLFVNRTQEVNALNRLRHRHGLAIVYGRRRVGKTRLLRRWVDHAKGHYSQAIEGSAALQLDQITNDLRKILPPNVTPKSWIDLLAFIELLPEPVT